MLYDFLAPAYDPVLKPIFRPYRWRALKWLPDLTGAAVLDLACGTGLNFPALAERIGGRGKIIGLDISAGMLARAQRRVDREGLRNVTLIQMNAVEISVAALKAYADITSIDYVVCTYGFTSMREWTAAFRLSWYLLKSGGGYLIHDVDGQKRNWRTWAVERGTRSDFSKPVWEPLESECLDFRMDYLDPSAHLFGGRLFVARGTKPATTPRDLPCPS